MSDLSFEADLPANEEQQDFDRFFNLIPDLACIVSTDGYFKKVNPAWEAAWPAATTADENERSAGVLCECGERTKAVRFLVP